MGDRGAGGCDQFAWELHFHYKPVESGVAQTLDEAKRKCDEAAKQIIKDAHDAR